MSKHSGAVPAAHVATRLMSPETYTFACPACRVSLSVPRALAGVRGPCPQCHQEITAPEPPAASFQSPFADRPAGSTAAPPLPEVAPVAKAAAPSAAALLTAEPADAPTEFPRWSPDPATEVEPPALPVGLDVAAGGKLARPERAPARPSRAAVVAGVVALLALAAAAALNFLPAGTLRGWLSRIGLDGGSRSKVVVMTPAPAPSTPATAAANPVPRPSTGEPPSTPDAGAPESVRSPDPVPVTPPPGGDPAPEGSTDLPAPPSLNPDSIAKSVSPAGTAAEGETGSPPAGRPISKEAPSLLPDISAAGADAPPSASSQGASTEEPSAGSEHAESLKALNDFLKAKSWKDRLLLSLSADRMRGEMEAYYRNAKDGPQPYTTVEFVTSEPLANANFSVHVFHVTFADLPQGFPIPVEQTPEGWKIDWRSYVEFREGRLKKFLGKNQDAPATFRVRLQRSHYFDKDVPRLSDKYCFRVAAPIDGHDGYVYLDKSDSIAGPKVADKLEWDRSYYVMVKLKWVKGAGGHPYVELRDVVADSWRDDAGARIGKN